MAALGKPSGVLLSALRLSSALTIKKLAGTFAVVYRSILQSSGGVRLLISFVPCISIATIFALRSRRWNAESRADDSLMTAAIRFVGAAFIFIGSFANVTAWQGAGSATANLKSELASLSALAESILDYEQDATLRGALAKISTYVETIRDTELSKNGIRGFSQDPGSLERKQRVKNSALNAPMVIKRDSAEQQALDIRSAIIAIEEADIVSERDLNRMLGQVDDFQVARRNRLSSTWPLVPEVVVATFVVITVALLVLIGLYPSGPRRGLKWLQVGASVAVVTGMWFAVLSTQDVSVETPRVGLPIEGFLSRYK